MEENEKVVPAKRRLLLRKGGDEAVLHPNTLIQGFSTSA